MINVVAKIRSIDKCAGNYFLKSIFFSFWFKFFDIIPDIAIGLLINFAISRDRSFLVRIGLTNDLSTIYFIISVISLTFIASIVAQFFLSLSLKKSASIVHHRLKLNFCRSALYSPIRDTAAELHDRNQDIETIDVFIKSTLEELLKLTFSSILVGIVLAMIAPQFLFYALLPLPLTFVIAHLLNKKIAPHHAQIRQASNSMQQEINELITCLPTIRDFSIEERIFNKIHNQAVILDHRRDLSNRLASMLMPATRVLIYAAFIAIMFHGIILVWHNELSIGSFAAAVFLSRKFLQPFSFSGSLLNNYRKGLASLKNLNVPRNVDDLSPTSVTICRNSSPRVALRDVSFSYGDRKILHNVNADFLPGKVNVIKGITGKGKTTICRLLMREFARDSGAIFFNETNIDEFALPDWKRQTALVGQHPQLFMATVANNITLFSPLVDENLFQQSLLASLTAQFVDKLPKGCDSLIGARGIKLSFGQIQSIALARALYQNPRVLLLDEPTTGFDEARELLFIDALKTIIKDRVVIIASHSQNIINCADYLLEI